MKLFSTGCPRCKIIEKELEKNNIQYELCKDEKIMIEKNIEEVPILELDNGTLLSYKEIIRWIKEV